MAKNAELIIYCIRSIETIEKIRSIEKITLLSKRGVWRELCRCHTILIPERRYSEGSAQD